MTILRYRHPFADAHTAADVGGLGADGLGLAVLIDPAARLGVFPAAQRVLDAVVVGEFLGEIGADATEAVPRAPFDDLDAGDALQIVECLAGAGAADRFDVGFHSARFAGAQIIPLAVHLPTGKERVVGDQSRLVRCFVLGEVAGKRAIDRAALLGSEHHELAPLLSGADDLNRPERAGRHRIVQCGIDVRKR